MKGYQLFGKRLLDIVLSAGSLAALSPVMAVAALAILIEDGRPVLFVHERVGHNQTTFRLLKFRSMRKDAANVPSALADDSIITRSGRVLRRTNLDELPQLVNILRGDMSIVGPRPGVGSQTELMALRQEGGAYSVRPGLTGLAQVNSYDGMSDDVKAKYDIEYVNSVTLWRDLAIVLRTFSYLLKPPPKY